MKKKLFICFKPLVIDSEGTNANHVDHSDVSIPSCLIVANDQNKKTSSTIKSSLCDSKNGKAPCPHKGRKKSQKSLSPSLKPTFDVSMRTSVHDENLYQLALQAKSTCARKSGKRLDLLDDKQINRKIVEANSGNSSMRSVVSSSSVSSSSMSRSSSEAKIGNCGISGSRSNSFDSNTQNTTSTSEKISGSSPGKNSVFYLIAFILFFTIFLGRVYAVLLTLLWVYFIPHRTLRSTGIAREGVLNGVHELA